MAGIIVAGYDEINGGQVFSIPLGGMVKRQGCAIGGSGSTENDKKLKILLLFYKCIN